MDTPAAQPQPIRDSWMAKFFAHLATDRGASAYTQRNYRQALTEFVRWHLEERKFPPGGRRSSAMIFAGISAFWGAAS